MQTIVYFTDEELDQLQRGGAVEIVMAEALRRSNKVFVRLDMSKRSDIRMNRDSRTWSWFRFSDRDHMSMPCPLTVQEIIDDAMEKRDRCVSLYFSPDGDMNVTIMPWIDDMEE